METFSRSHRLQPDDRTNRGGGGILTFSGNVLPASHPVCGVAHRLHMASLLICLFVLDEIGPLLSPLTTQRK